MNVFSTALARPVMLVVRFLQWSSAVIVMGITSYFIHNFRLDSEHIIYQEVIATISVAFFLPGFLSPFMPNILSPFVFANDVAFSYLWLTAFIFAAQDYDWHSCMTRAPLRLHNCSIKFANEAFIFLAFIFTFFAMFLEIWNLWSYRKENSSTLPEKQAPAGRAPLDAPADTGVGNNV